VTLIFPVTIWVLKQLEKKTNIGKFGNNGNYSRNGDHSNWRNAGNRGNKKINVTVLKLVIRVARNAGRSSRKATVVSFNQDWKVSVNFGKKSK
jgi:hypothetical protein